MEYFILLPGDHPTAIQNDCNKLGESNQFGKFWTADGFKVLNNIVNNRPDLVETITILNDKGKKLTIGEFLNVLKQYKLIV